VARRPGLTRERLLEAATELIDGRGPDALALAPLATRFGVRSPSLYNHVNGLGDLRGALTLRGLERLGDALTAAVAGRAGPGALAAVAHAYRAFALAHPGLYALTQRAVTGGTASADSDALERASNAVVEVVLAVLRGYGLEGDAAIHATRALRSALHGFVALETGGGFGMPQAVDVSFARLVSVLDAGLQGELAA